MFFVFEIIAFELGVANFYNLEQDTCHQQPICKKKPLRLHLTLGETFYESSFQRMMKKRDKSALIETSQVYAMLSHVDSQSVF